MKALTAQTVVTATATDWALSGGDWLDDVVEVVTGDNVGVERMDLHVDPPVRGDIRTGSLAARLRNDKKG